MDEKPRGLVLEQQRTLAMKPPDGQAFHLAGEFLEIDPPGRLVYTFRWEEPDPDDRETVVALALDAVGRVDPGIDRKSADRDRGVDNLLATHGSAADRSDAEVLVLLRHLPAWDS
jgi:uncharacterized protein YndB with AHSA1/START domain